VDLRQFFVEWRPDWGILRAGQMSSHWGLGVVFNDGDHPTLFGDPLRSDAYERVMVATQPFGKTSPWIATAGADLVYSDRLASLREGDIAMQTFVGIIYSGKPHAAGINAAYRHQVNDDEGDLDIGSSDVFGRFVVGHAGDAELFAALEAAAMFGRGTLARNIYVPDHTFMQMGGVAQVGVNHKRVATTIEGGWTSGDADPFDDEIRRFTLSSDHNVGLVLFDEVIASQTARAATLAMDPELTGRAAPGVYLLPTDGGVGGAAYASAVTQTFFGDRSWTVYGGVLGAIATSDVVDPYRVQATGAMVNYQGGDPSGRNLGLEFDAGIGHLRAVGSTQLSLSIEGGVLVPGDAFADADGEIMSSVGLARARASLAF
jgi:hypothetical protein